MSHTKKIIGGVALAAGAAIGAGYGIAKGVRKAVRPTHAQPVFGLICPMEEETAPFREAMDIAKTTHFSGLVFYEGVLWGQRAVLVQCGVGKVNAAICAQALCSHFPITYLINIGVAGTTRPGVRQGDLVLSTDAVQHDVDVTARGFAPGEIPDLAVSAFRADPGLIDLATRAFDAETVEMDGARLFTGRIVSGDQFIAGGARADAIQATFDPCAVEMEGAAVAHAATLNAVPFLIVRAISDNADENAPGVSYPEFLPLAIVHTVALVCRMFALAGDAADA